MPENELRECPLCGAKVKIVTVWKNATIECVGCGLILTKHSSSDSQAKESAAVLWNTRAPDSKLREALEVVIEVLKIASDWNAPTNYDIKVRKGWECTLDPESDEPEWPTLYGIIGKLEAALAEGK